MQLARWTSGQYGKLCFAVGKAYLPDATGSFLIGVAPASLRLAHERTTLDAGPLCLQITVTANNIVTVVIEYSTNNKGLRRRNFQVSCALNIEGFIPSTKHHGFEMLPNRLVIFLLICGLLFGGCTVGVSKGGEFRAVQQGPSAASSLALLAAPNFQAALQLHIIVGLDQHNTVSLYGICHAARNSLAIERPHSLPLARSAQ